MHSTRMFMTLLGLVKFLSVNSFALPFEGLWRLDVIHYNDFHARFEETSVTSSICRTNDSLCLGGFPRLFAEVKALLKEKPKALLLNAGDSFQGTFWYNLLKWNITQQFMNMLPHDAHAIGNHEFDNGPAGLAPYIAHLKAPCLAANMDASEEPVLQNLYKNHTIVERDGRKIGIIGVITVETLLFATPGGVKITDERVAAQREAAILTEQGVDIIVLLSHAGLKVDRDIAANYGENIDLIVGGHTHSLLWNGRSPSGETVADVYPIVVQPSNNSDHKVLIVQASAYTKYMGNLSVFFDLMGNYRSWEGGPIFLNRSYPEDDHIKETLSPYAKAVHKAYNESLAQTEVDLDRDSCAFGECLLGDVYCEAILEEVQQNYPTTLHDVAIISLDNIHTGFPKGSITAGAVFEAFPYNDKLYTFKIQGRYLIQTLEHGLAVSVTSKPFQSQRLVQVAGVRVTFNASAAVNERVLSVELPAARAHRKLDPEQYVRLTAPAYIADGGGGFTMLAQNRVDQIQTGRDSDVFRKYIQKHSPLHPQTDGRIVVHE